MSIENARKKRSSRSRALQRLANGRLGVREVLSDGHDSLTTCPVHLVMVSAPDLGPETVRRILESKHIWPLTPLGQLTELERQTIIGAIPERII